MSIGLKWSVGDERPWPVVKKGKKCVVQTHSKSECDINLIISKFQKDGILPSSVRSEPGRYIDLTMFPDFNAASRAIAGVKSAFANLPPDVRERFNNAQDKFVEFVQDPRNARELVTMGLAVPRKATGAKSPVAAPGDGGAGAVAPAATSTVKADGVAGEPGGASPPAAKPS